MAFRGCEKRRWRVGFSTMKKTGKVQDIRTVPHHSDRNYTTFPALTASGKAEKPYSNREHLASARESSSSVELTGNEQRRTSRLRTPNLGIPPRQSRYSDSAVSVHRRVRLGIPTWGVPVYRHRGSRSTAKRVSVYREPPTSSELPPFPKRAFF